MNSFLSKLITGLKKLVSAVSAPMIGLLGGLLVILFTVFWWAFNLLDKAVLGFVRASQEVLPKAVQIILAVIQGFKSAVTGVTNVCARIWDASPSFARALLMPLALIAKPIWRLLVWIFAGIEKIIHIVLDDIQKLRGSANSSWKSVKARGGLDDLSIAERKQELASRYSADAIHSNLTRRLEEFKEVSERELNAFFADLKSVWQRYQDARNNKSSHNAVAQMSPFEQERNTILVASIIINVLALAFPLLMLQLYDRILPRQSSDTLVIFAVGVGLAVALESMIRVLRSYATAWISARFEHRAYLSLADRLLAEPLHSFERKGTGAVMEDFKSVSTLKYHYSGQTFQQLMDLPFTILYILIIFLISPWIGLLLLAGYSIFVFITWKNGRDDPALIKEQKEGDLRRANFLNEILKNVHTLKSMTMESLMLRRYERLQENCAKLMARMTYALDMSAGVGNVFSPLMTVLVVALGAYLVIMGRLSNGELAACVLLGMRALAPLQRLGGMWAKYQQDEVLRDKLAKALDHGCLPTKVQEDVVDALAKTIEVDTKPADLKLNQVTYQFPAIEKPLFENLSLHIRAGECVAIGGQGGAGRSTLLQLMSGIIQPQSGDVLLNDINLKALPIDSFTKQIAYLPQKAVMFEGSLLDNATVYDADRVDDALRIAKELGLADFVSKMPRGWDSIVGDMAADSMPPGYRQRIAIVRALSSNPNIVLFDDASSAMDSEGDGLLLKYLETIRGKVTLILVSERPSFLRLADRKYILQDGQLIEAPAGGFNPLREVSQSGMKVASIPSATPRQVLPASYQPLSAESFFQSPFKQGGMATQKWEHMHKTVSGNFKDQTDFSGCLSLLLKLLNSQDTTRAVAESLPYFTDNLDLTGFQNAMAQLNYKVSEVECRLSEIDTRALPCLFVPNEGKAFVVLGRIGNQLRIGQDSVTEPRLEANLAMEGRAYFYERAEFKLPDNKSWVAHTLYRFAPLIGQASLSSLVSGVVIMSGSLFLMLVYSTIIPSGALDTLFYLSIGAFIALAFSYFFIRQRASILAFISGRIEYLFGTAILQHVLAMPPSYTERASVGSQTARLQAFEGIRDLFTGPIASTLLETPATLVLLIGLSIINPIALLLFVIMVAVYAALFLIFSRRTNDSVIEVSRTSTKRTEFLIEMTGKMRFIRESGAQYLWLERLRETSASATMAAFKAEKLSSLLVGVSYFVMMLAALLIVSFTTPAVIDQKLSSGALIASMMLMWRVLTPLQTAFVNMTRLERITSATRQIDTLMRIQGERQENAASPIARGLEGRIEFARVSFRYSMNVDPALIGVEFRVQPGEMVAISGPNGGGKSTLLKMLLGMYQPQAGSILIDGVDIRQLDSQELRRLIGYAPQDMQFFRATIAQNLRMARPDATDDEVYQALDMAGALDTVLSLPRGINYRLGDNTNELPSGLKQKLLLARTYLTRAPIMIFDEPGSGLDPEGDAKFIEALKALKGRTTVLFISHRPSHIRLADTLLVFDKGYLRAAGPPNELLKQPTNAAA